MSVHSVARGCYRIGVGRSSRDVPLQAQIGRGVDCGGPLQLPQSSRTCTSRRNFLIHLPRKMRRARVTYAGRRAKVRRGRRRLVARIDMRGIPGKRRVRVRVVGRTRSGKVVRQVRVYRLCG